MCNNEFNSGEISVIHVMLKTPFAQGNEDVWQISNHVLRTSKALND